MYFNQRVRSKTCSASKIEGSLCFLNGIKVPCERINLVFILFLITTVYVYPSYYSICLFRLLYSTGFEINLCFNFHSVYVDSSSTL
jgi:hypothetical protein